MTKTPFLLAAATLALAGCSTISELPTERLGQARLSFANGLPAGTVQLLADGDSLSLGIAATGLSPGAHGFHLHMTGRCEAPDFQSAGGHLNPYGRNHGELSPGGSHLGDMRNLEVGAGGTVTTTVAIDGSRAAGLEQIFDADGTAVVIHAEPDDYRSQPSGDAGSRVACGVLTRG